MACWLVCQLWINDDIELVQDDAPNVAAVRKMEAAAGGSGQGDCSAVLAMGPVFVILTRQRGVCAESGDRMDVCMAYRYRSNERVSNGMPDLHCRKFQRDLGATGRSGTAAKA
jgi:hypothetical protein